jgi:hypothetical protein
MLCYGGKPADNLIRGLRMLPRKGTPGKNALNRLGHVQPGSAQWRVEWHNAPGNQPENEVWGFVPG